MYALKSYLGTLSGLLALLFLTFAAQPAVAAELVMVEQVGCEW